MLGSLSSPSDTRLTIRRTSAIKSPPEFSSCSAGVKMERLGGRWLVTIVADRKFFGVAREGSRSTSPSQGFCRLRGRDLGVPQAGCLSMSPKRLSASTRRQGECDRAGASPTARADIVCETCVMRSKRMMASELSAVPFACGRADRTIRRGPLRRTDRRGHAPTNPGWLPTGNAGKQHRERQGKMRRP
jgi:hypothetical protein